MQNAHYLLRIILNKNNFKKIIATSTFFYQIFLQRTFLSFKELSVNKKANAVLIFLAFYHKIYRRYAQYCCIEAHFSWAR